MSLMRPWRSMWFQPRKTIRWIVETNPSYGIFWLAGVYILQSLLFFLNFWSIGFKFSHYAILIPSFLAAPLLGVLWIWFYGWILRSTGRWFGGKAPASHIRAALAWSRLPAGLSLLVWVFLFFYRPQEMFIQHGPGSLAAFVHALLFFFWGWTLVLFVQAIREVQHFSFFRAILNIFISWIIYSAIIFSIMLISRFLSIYLS